MKLFSLRRLSTALFVACVAYTSVYADNLVILHTNDTHSQIDPNDKNLGGILRRKVIIDSVHANNRNLLVIDAGDAVQGTMYFNLYKGDVEYSMLDILGYDMAILGNHDFDNKSESLGELLKKSNIEWISTNYDFSDEPLKSIFKPYTIKEFNGKRFGFIGLNLNPHGMIAEGHSNGVVYNDALDAANRTAAYLKNKGNVDMVIAVSHLGYSGRPEPKDLDIARNSSDIDIIIGGHSHTYLAPDDSAKIFIPNLNGKPVLIAQVGKQGMNVGEITINLDSLTYRYNTIAVDSRLDNRTSPDLEKTLVPYRAGIDSLMRIKIGESAVELPNNEVGLQNFIADFGFDIGSELIGKKVDIAIMNKGSLRQSLPKGDITLGMILMMQPFNNKITVIELSGKDLLDAFDVMASRGGDAVSAGVDATMVNGKCSKVLINGKKINPKKTYCVATIDYLANGGDYMEPLRNGKVLVTTPEVVNHYLRAYFENNLKGTQVNPEQRARMHN